LPKDGPERVCAYCGDASARLTREHVWPRWLSFEIGNEREPYAHAVDGNVTRTWWGPPASLTVKRICATCNNGWMSRCEDSVEPILRPMIRNAALSIPVAEQKLLAIWALKTGTACDLATGRPAAPAELRRELVDASDIPDGITALVARYAGTRYPLLAGSWVKTLDFEIANRPFRQRCLQLTVGAGPVVFQIFGHGLAGVAEFRPVGLKADFMQVIWPAMATLCWPLPTALGDDGLRRLAAEP